MKEDWPERAKRLWDNMDKPAQKTFRLRVMDDIIIPMEEGPPRKKSRPAVDANGRDFESILRPELLSDEPTQSISAENLAKYAETIQDEMARILDESN